MSSRTEDDVNTTPHHQIQCGQCQVEGSEMSVISTNDMNEQVDKRQSEHHYHVLEAYQRPDTRLSDYRLSKCAPYSLTNVQRNKTIYDNLYSRWSECSEDRYDHLNVYCSLGDVRDKDIIGHDYAHISPT